MKKKTSEFCLHVTIKLCYDLNNKYPAKSSEALNRKAFVHLLV